MPGMGGLNFITSLRPKEKTRSLPEVILTVDPDLDAVETGRDLGVLSYVRKPVKPEMLLERVLPILQGQ